MSSSVQDGRITKTTRRKRDSKRQAQISRAQQQDQYQSSDDERYLLPLVERTNELSIRKFTKAYVPTHLLSFDTTTTTTTATKTPGVEEPATTTTPPKPPTLHYKIDIYDAATIPSRDLDQCFNLIEQTSADAYRVSSVGWSPAKKRKEMKLPDMKYLVLRRDGADGAADDDGEGPDVVGFLSFMITYEDGLEVIYCYEVHLLPEVQRQGLGGRLLRLLLEIGRRVGMEKAMLTVFRSNAQAQRFYGALGFGTDESNPRPRRLRNGMVKEPDYRIMSIRLDGGPDA
ncbi:acyl-CoA N-acyltransferase [Aspergillus ellipticus CBS 707.79]|uniref:N-alpha-acetyltransferase 40 n=1 Tax=Aspergillus ellipticus CBS 707.79 TaxID=1448320 RepID=A0A319D4W3_9EURO|nr:acyl-CoA N-acyltransferase [Aspergillus ellipticus CBS 707.79]